MSIGLHIDNEMGDTMFDYFKELRNRIVNASSNLEVINNAVLECKMDNTFDLFAFGISDRVKYIYNNYKKFVLSWQDKSKRLYGVVNFVPYEDLRKENMELREFSGNMEDGLIEDQEIVVNDLKYWYPIFKFPNGDAFCYDERTGKVVFFEHEVFDTGINLHGLIIADSIDFLLEQWSKVLFVDIYDWYEGVNELGIDLSKSVYESVLQINNNY